MEEKTYRMLMSLPVPGMEEAPFNPAYRHEHYVNVQATSHAEAFGRACVMLENRLGLYPGPHNKIRNEDFGVGEDSMLRPPNSPRWDEIAEYQRHNASEHAA